MNENENDLSEKTTLIQNRNGASLSVFHRVAYGFGHVLNDLCAAMWFSYLLFYMQIILQMKSTTAGVLLMIGQIADALATPVAGLLVDKYFTRVLWHVIGTVLISISFPLVFATCWFCSDDEIQKLFYHIIVIIMFQIGWAIVQISHLSIIPNLTDILAQRSELTAIRYTASVCSSVVTYIITWIVLRTNALDEKKIGPSDYYKFQEIVLLILGVGIIASIIFYYGISRSRANLNSNNDLNDSTTINISIFQVFLSPLIYQISLLYVASRLYMTLNLVYMPLYLDERVSLNVDIDTENLRESLASVPLVSFLSSFVTSLMLKGRAEFWGNKVTYFIGSMISLSSCIWIGFYLPQSSGMFNIYAVAILIGAGSSITIVSSLCLTADMIGPNINQGASVYSIVTFTDKLICGVAVAITEYLKCEDKTLCPEYYRYVLAFVSGGATVFGLIVLSTLSIYQKRQFSLFVR